VWVFFTDWIAIVSPLIGNNFDLQNRLQFGT
jgi:hypothetical protein